VLPGTGHKTNPTAAEMIQRNTIFTNAAVRPDGTPVVGRPRRSAAARGAGLAGAAVDAGVV
jgi:GTP-dependent phosphoenolpyruvate carboxykinase